MKTLYNNFVEGAGKLRDIPLLLFRLILGLGSRLIAMPMMFIMAIATFTVHISNGFAAGDNGFEIPLYYFLMLFALVIYGSGKYSVDYLIANRSK